jgi:hypothetical protein
MNLKEMRAICDRASDGPFIAGKDFGASRRDLYSTFGKKIASIYTGTDAYSPDVEFFQTFHPGAVAALLDRIERLENEANPMLVVKAEAAE